MVAHKINDYFVLEKFLCLKRSNWIAVKKKKIREITQNQLIIHFLKFICKITDFRKIELLLNIREVIG